MLPVKIFKIFAILVGLVLLSAAGVLGWYLYTKQPVRDGTLRIKSLQAKVEVNFDTRGVPHIRAHSELAMYRVLGYVHAQDRLFQMEMLRRLARGELAEVLGPDLLPSDKLFRTLGLRQRAEQFVLQADRSSPAFQALLAYVDGINHSIANHPVPLEFDALGIPKRAFSVQDCFAVMGYMAYASASALKTEPVLTYIRDQLGAQYLDIFDLQWQALNVLEDDTLAQLNWNALSRLAQASHHPLQQAGLPLIEGSNALVFSGNLTASRKPILAGDPHHSYSVPGIWYEAHLSHSRFHLYGYFHALNPMALLGHNYDFGWTTTLLHNDDMDLVAETVNPNNRNQVWYQGQWVDLQSRVETILVKNQDSQRITVRTSPHGPIVTDAFAEHLEGVVSKTPVSLWWVFLQSDNPLLQGLYELNRADTLAKARNAASKIEAPGMNILWANEAGDIGWWATGKMPQRPAGVHPSFILNAAKGEADKPGYYYFGFNPQEENPPRGFILSANQQPHPPSGVPVPGYYSPPYRARALHSLIQETQQPWTPATVQALQLHDKSTFAPRLMRPLLLQLRAVVTDPNDAAFLELFEKWEGEFSTDMVQPTLFSQLLYELAYAAFADELGDAQFNNLLHTRLMDNVLLKLVENPQSPWWDDVTTSTTEKHLDTVRIAWGRSMAHLQKLHGSSLLDWRWGKNHTLTHSHMLSGQKYWGWLLDIGPFSVAGGRETPLQMAYTPGKSPWAVTFGPSSRRIVDFDDAGKAIGIQALGQSGVPFNRHYQDQAAMMAKSIYAPLLLDDADITKNTRSTLLFLPSY